MSESIRPRQPADGAADPSAANPSVAGGPAANASPGDLSRQIERSVTREPSDSVRCTHVYGSFYRCNWWSRLGLARNGQDYDWAGLLTDQIRKSRFLKATIDGEKLVVVEVSPVSSYTSAILSD